MIKWMTYVEATQPTDVELLGGSKRLPNNRPTVITLSSSTQPPHNIQQVGPEDLGFRVRGDGGVLLSNRIIQTMSRIRGWWIF